MAILLAVTDRDVRPLKEKMEAVLPEGTDVWIYPELPDPGRVRMIVVWKHPPGLFSQLPNLEVISSLGAGVEHILKDPALPAGVAVTRVVDDKLTVSMRNYVVMAALNIHKQLAFYLQHQRQQKWEKPSPVEHPLRIGMLGLGALGSAIARFLADMGFEVTGFSRSRKEIAGVVCLNEDDHSLEDFARRINLLVCLLPLTPATEGILNYHLFSRMPRGAALINVARGAHLVEADLLRAIEEGYIREAYLDVFQEEPLPAGHPFWMRPEIVLTPHVASITDQDNAAAILAGNFRRMSRGEPLAYEVDPSQGY
jgi:glyoxylate/hydroxypyruvate reductase A